MFVTEPFRSSRSSRSVSVVPAVITLKNGVPKQSMLYAETLERHGPFPCWNGRSGRSGSVPTNYDDDGYGPIPSRWKDMCQVGDAFDPANCNCNCKIIDAHYYTAVIDPAQLEDYLSPRNFNGHDTLTASVAADSIVYGANFHGLASGVARGGAPHTRLAMYKVVWGSARGTGATNSAIVLAAVDDAIHDGVDVLSLSLALSQDNSFGVLHAVAKGVTAVYAAGNSGLTPQTVGNTAPWIITVVASAIDRAFPTSIRLGNNKAFVASTQSRLFSCIIATGYKRICSFPNRIPP
ncbi:hypothetical protein ZIOFF_016928 [Zingiber officinale]|uniref:Peptidase S8/S53 domain-containing protein n=1 Tax=Zingiber officinale TaxID=94328 RepID=A0A8J5LKX6_ZINOF|nr:hypothetical protein ZIOFF_016928 [Zingiber officinale]